MADEKSIGISLSRFAIDQSTFLTKAGVHLPYGTSFGPMFPFNFLNANIDLLPFGDNEEELESLKKIQFALTQQCAAESDFTLDDVATQILRDETSFDLSEYNLHTSASGASGAIITILRSLKSKKKSVVAYSSPNWIFDEIVAQVPIEPLTFHSVSGDQFVEAFERLPGKDMLTALIIPDPANPAGFSLSPDHIKRIEEISLPYGIVPIFDDVFRGLKQKGERHTASEYSESSIVVETTSKRFGSRGLGVTWTLVPKYMDIEGLGISCQGCSNIAATVTKALYETGYDTKISNFLKRNTAAFLAGFTDAQTQDTGYFVLPFEGSPFFDYVIREGPPFSSEICKSLPRTLMMTSGVNWIRQRNEKIKCLNEDDIKLEFLIGERYLRICPTKETPDRSYLAGGVLAETIQALKEK